MTIYSYYSGSLPKIRFFISAAVLLCLIIALLISKRHNTAIANGVIISVFMIFATTILLFWGIDSISGVLAISFAILLPSLLLSPRSILRVTLFAFVALTLVNILHTYKVITPISYVPQPYLSPIDLVGYWSALSVLALVSWRSSQQTKIHLLRAQKAEEEMRLQKDSIAFELEKESARLRNTQLLQVQQLHKFASIGQSTTATLHELANHLSILNLDIDDLKTANNRSRSVRRAKESIERINKMIKTTRLQLNSDPKIKSLSVWSTLSRSSKDIACKDKNKHVAFNQMVHPDCKQLHATCSVTALTQSVSILLNNAFDACRDSPNASVSLTVSKTKRSIIISVSDNGPGLPDKIKERLFQPVESTKPAGLGVGLYIAHHLVRTQLNGHLHLAKGHGKTEFKIRFPLNPEVSRTATKKRTAKVTPNPVLAAKPTPLHTTPPPHALLEVAEL